MVGVNKAGCIACGLCFGNYSDMFELWPDGKAQVKKVPVSKEDFAIYEEAKSNCPVQAIE